MKAVCIKNQREGKSNRRGHCYASRILILHPGWSVETSHYLWGDMHISSCLTIGKSIYLPGGLGLGERLTPLSQLCLVSILPEGGSWHLPSPPWFCRKRHYQHGPASFLPRFTQRPHNQTHSNLKEKDRHPNMTFCSVCSQIGSREQEIPFFPGSHLICPPCS